MTTEVSWETTTADLDADGLIAAKRSTGKQHDAVEWLAEQLADGPLYVSELERRAKAAKVAWRTVERAKKTLGLHAVKDIYGWQWKHA